MSQTNTPTPRPITARAAENGLRVGIYLCALLLAAGISASVPFAGLLVWGGTFYLPVFLYRMLRRSDRLAEGSLGFAELWAEGIASFFLGTLFPALLAYVLLKFVAPTFIADTIADAISIFESQGTAEWSQWAENLKTTAGAHMPTAVDVSVQLISFNIVAGTTLSLVTAAIVKLSGNLSGQAGRSQ